MLWLLKQIFLDAKSRKTDYVLSVERRSRLRDTFCGDVQLQKTYGVCVVVRSKNFVL
jgi:hypothetical protein